MDNPKFEQKLGQTLGMNSFNNFPKYKKEGSHNVVTDGIHKGTRFDTLDDLSNIMKETDKRADKVVSGLNSQFQHLPKEQQVTRDEFYRYPEHVQKRMLNGVENQERKEMLKNNLPNVNPQEKARKIKLYKEFVLPSGVRDKYSDEEIWQLILKGDK